MADSVPLVNVDILKKNHVRLVQDVDVDCVLPVLEPFLLYTEIDAVKSKADQCSRTRELIDCLNKRTAAKSYEAFNAFMKILGGTQPELFSSLANRPASPSEVDLCVRGFSRELKKNIAETGHKTDSPLDEEIDFDTQYIQLHIIKNDPYGESFAKTDTEDLYLSSQGTSLPHQYQKHITEVQNDGENIPACNVLNVGKVQAKRVLLSGRAGVGKTTTLQWLAQQWALEKWATGFTLLFLMQLRMLSNTEIKVTAIELFTVYGLFQLMAGDSHQVLCSWLKNAAGKVVILLDGLDELAGFSKKNKNTPKITDLNQKAHPLELCINILRGDLLPGCTLICTSRPFTGLSSLCTDTVVEILGLTQQDVVKYVEQKHPQKAQYIMSVLHRNPMLMSVCGITFYCMAVSTLLSQGVEILDEEVKTYTRLTAFIIVQYVTRKLPDWPFVIQVTSYFPKLAQLADMGIFQSKEDQGLSKLVFNEYDVCEVGLTPSDLESVKMGGILRIEEVKKGKRNGIIAEFLHLTMQEMLAVAHLLSKPLPSIEMLGNVFSSNQFNMARMYLFGLQYDKESDWIKDVCRAVSPSGLCADGDNSAHISEFLKNLCSEQDNTLIVCQLVHESQMEDLARSVVDYVAPDGVLTIKLTPMTAIDVGAVAFVCACSNALKQITLIDVNTDDTVMKVMSSSLIQPHITSIQSLDVSRNSIMTEGAETLAKIIQQSTCLETLDVSSNKIGVNGALALAEALHTNSSLHVLKVSCNAIGAEGAILLSQGLVHNHTLQELDVSFNCIGVNGSRALIEALHTNNSLQVLNVSDNAIGDDGAKALTEALHTNNCLQVLNISCNSIGVDGAKALTEALHTNNSLQVLDVSGNAIGDDGAGALAESLHTNNSLQVLNILGNDLGDDGAKALAEALHVNTSLKTLHLMCNEIGEDGAVSLSQALVNNHTLQELDVSYNEIGVNGARALAEALHTNNSLQVLNVSDNAIGVDGAKALTEALHTNNSLQVLDISCNSIGVDGAKALTEALHTNNSLQVLDVSGNAIGDDGAGALAESLHTNNSLQVLNILGNDIGDDGAKALAEALHVNTSLKTLHLMGNKIGEDGAVSLSQALVNNHTLQELYVVGNAIGVDGAKALAEALHTNSSLQKLYVIGNAIGDDGAKALAESLYTNNSLEVLDISFNAIGVDSAKALAEALHTNNSLQVLDTSFNAIGVDGAKALAEALHASNSLQVLNVSQNAIGDEGAEALAEAFQ